MKARKTKTTIAVIGEGPTEKYYLKSLEGVIHAQVKPVVPNHATSMAELERRISSVDAFIGASSILFDGKKLSNSRIPIKTSSSLFPIK